MLEGRSSETGSEAAGSGPYGICIADTADRGEQLVECRRMLRKLLILMCCFFVPAAASGDDANVDAAKKYVSRNVLPWVDDPVIIDAVRDQNAKHANLTPAEINRLDLNWRAQVTTSDRPMVDEVLGRDISRFLARKQDASRGLITEIFVMDNKGLNVGQSTITSDYWQGDEAKWQQTFNVGPGVVFVDGGDVDESTRARQSQASITISDPATGEVIGAITVGIDLDRL
ncbi:MAG: hypothetical protein RIB70_07060 [Roseitalea porphyridii]|uniref:hypothetical protein n=1 Tax=Roseitalea porphyridii TaxID=1852022 RepID=UPI0032ED2F97